MTSEATAKRRRGAGAIGSVLLRARSHRPSAQGAAADPKDRSSSDLCRGRKTRDTSRVKRVKAHCVTDFAQQSSAVCLYSHALRHAYSVNMTPRLCHTHVHVEFDAAAPSSHCKITTGVAQSVQQRSRLRRDGAIRVVSRRRRCKDGAAGTALQGWRYSLSAKHLHNQ